ncbi:MAG TPA: flagellar export chaperone FliS [Verrucomicrobiales bacterium]|nr:flagellar export chaperone FliS [Verrucomicrobiales bacterium]
MTYGNPWQSYRQVATTTAPPGHLVLMLYDGAIRFLNGALAGFDLDDPLEFHQTINNNLLRAQDIINELNASLNMQAGGEFSERLRALYIYFDRRLQESNVQKDPAGIREVVQRLTVLRTAWHEMLGKSVEGAPPLPQVTPGHVSLEATG